MSNMAEACTCCGADDEEDVEGSISAVLTAY